MLLVISRFGSEKLLPFISLSVNKVSLSDRAYFRGFVSEKNNCTITTKEQRREEEGQGWIEEFSLLKYIAPVIFLENLLGIARPLHSMIEHATSCTFIDFCRKLLPALPNLLYSYVH